MKLKLVEGVKSFDKTLIPNGTQPAADTPAVIEVKPTDTIITAADLELMVQKRGRGDITDLYVKDSITDRHYQKMAIKAVCENGDITKETIVNEAPFEQRLIVFRAFFTSLRSFVEKIHGVIVPPALESA